MDILIDGQKIENLTLAQCKAALGKRITDARAAKAASDKEKRAMNAEEQAVVQRVLDEADPLQARITDLGREEEMRSKLGNLDNWFNGSTGRKTDPEQPGRIPGEGEGTDALGEDEKRDERRQQARSIAFRRFIRHGESRMTTLDRELLGPPRHMGVEESRAFGAQQDPELRQMLKLAGEDPDSVEHRDANVGTTTQGGYVVAPLFQASISQAAKLYQGPRQAGSEHITGNSGADLPFPKQDDTANEATIISEAADLTASDITLGQKVISTYMFTTGVIKASVQLLQDSAVNVEAWLTGLLATRMGRGTNTYWTTGSGTSQPQGLEFALRAGANIGVTSAANNAITADDFLALQHAVDPAYRSNPASGYGLSDGMLNKVRILKDSYGRYLLSDAVQGGPAKIWNKPFTIFTKMQAGITASTVAAIFGDMSYYKTREVAGMTLFRFNELYMQTGQVGFVLFGRWGGGYVDPGNHPVQSYAIHA